MYKYRLWALLLLYMCLIYFLITDTHHDNNSSGKFVLPTAPRASRSTAFDESKLPTTGPFQAYLSNIPYDLNEDELVALFQDLKVLHHCYYNYLI